MANQMATPPTMKGATCVNVQDNEGSNLCERPVHAVCIELVHEVARLVIIACTEVVDGCQKHPRHPQQDDGKGYQQQHALRVVAGYLALYAYVLHQPLEFDFRSLLNCSAVFLRNLEHRFLLESEHTGENI